MSLSATSSTRVHDELHKLHVKLTQILDAMVTYEPPIPKPPIIDSSLDDPKEESGISRKSSPGEVSPGLKALKESVKRDLEVLDKFLDDPKSATSPALSTNAPYLIAVWNEVLTAPQPVITIWKTFSEQEEHIQSQSSRPDIGSTKCHGTKVDLVADDGMRWIRINTIKNNRILAEFREIDSYLTDSEDESSDETQWPPTLAQLNFDNSILRMARSLISAATIADKHRASTEESGYSASGISQSIKVTMRLTRLNPDPEDSSQYDPRIDRTIRELEKMGIDVQLGEIEIPPRPVRLLRRPIHPTTKINLDLSILIALISDLTHSPLPCNAEEADARFVPPMSYVEWKKKRNESTGKGDDPKGDGEQKGIPDSEKHPRALVGQVLQEMHQGLLQEIRDKLLAAIQSSSSTIDAPISDVEFWTTAEARDRCLQIVSKIGGPNEKKRARALFYPSLTNDFWSKSRYENNFVPIPFIRIFPSEPAPNAPLTATPTSFFHVLEMTCIHILCQEIVPHPKALSSDCKVISSMPHSGFTSSVSSPEDDGGDSCGMESPLDGLVLDGEIQRATVTKANPKLTAHTVQSMLQGAKRGWTTLTANKASVKAILKEIKALHGPLMGLGGLVAGTTADGCNESEGEEDGNSVEKAAIWIMDPRSLAEAMRSDSTPAP